MRQPYRKQGQIVEPDPFPSSTEDAKKAAIARKVRRVALLARKLVAMTRTADAARDAFPEARELHRQTTAAVLRTFESMSFAVDEWKALER